MHIYAFRADAKLEIGQKTCNFVQYCNLENVPPYFPPEQGVPIMKHKN